MISQIWNDEEYRWMSVSKRLLKECHFHNCDKIVNQALHLQGCKQCPCSK